VYDSDRGYDIRGVISMGKSMGRSAVFMPFEIKIRFRKLMEEYEKIIGENLTEWQFLQILLDNFENKEDIAIEKKIEDLKKNIDELKDLIIRIKAGNYVAEILKQNIMLIEENKKLQEEIEKLKEEEIEKLKKREDKQIPETHRGIFRLLMYKVLQNVPDNFRKEVERDLISLELNLFTGDNLDIAKLKKIVNILKEMRFPTF